MSKFDEKIALYVNIRAQKIYCKSVLFGWHIKV